MPLSALLTSGVIASDYIPLVKRGNSDFKTLFSPYSPDATIENGVVTLFSFIGPVENGLTKWRVFIPPGTKTLQMTMYTYASPPENFIVMKLESPPMIQSVSEIKTTNNGSEANVLQNLMNDFELVFTSPAGSGGTKLSSLSNSGIDYKSQKGGWLYINALQIPGAKVFKLESFITVDETCYKAWYAKTSFDDYGNPFEFITHTCDDGASTPIVVQPDEPVITPVVVPVQPIEPIVNATEVISVKVTEINDGKLTSLDLEVTPTLSSSPYTTFWIAAIAGDSWFLNVPDLGWQGWNPVDKQFLLSSAYTSFESWSATRHISVPLFVPKPDLDALLNQGVKVYLVLSPTMEKHQRTTIDLNSPSTIKILGN